MTSQSNVGGLNMCYRSYIGALRSFQNWDMLCYMELWFSGVRIQVLVRWNI